MWFETGDVVVAKLIKTYNDDKFRGNGKKVRTGGTEQRNENECFFQHAESWK